MNDQKSVLFVCLGNICRSPTGEGVLQKFLSDKGLSESVFVDSAGTIGYHDGNAADSRMKKAAATRGYDLLSRSRKVTHEDMERFDLVLAMDRSNFDDLQSVHNAPTATVMMLSDFLDDNWPDDVPDPYYGGAQGFEVVLDMIEAACPAIITWLVGDE